MIDTTRRAFIAGSAMAAVAASVPAAALALPADRRAWEFAMATYLRAKAEADDFDTELFRIHDAWKAGKPTMDGIHWRALIGLAADRDHIARSMNLDKAWRDFLAAEGRTWWGNSPAATERMKARYRAALDSVQEYRDACERNDEATGMDAANDHSEALTDRMMEALDTLLEMPAPDLAALRWKLDQFMPNDGHGSSAWDAGYLAQTLADIARLLPPAG